MLASVGNDGTVRLWDVATGTQKSRLIEYTSTGSSFAFSLDGNTFAGGSVNATIDLWDLATVKHTRTLKDIGIVTRVAFSPDAQTLAFMSHGDTLYVRNIATETLEQSISGYTYSVNSVAFSPDGHTLASGDVGAPFHLWNVATGKSDRTLTGHIGTVNNVAFSPDGKILALMQHRLAIRLWDTKTGKLNHSITDIERVFCIAFSSNDNLLASGSYATVYLWDAVSGELKHLLKGHTGEVKSIAFSPDGKILACGGEVEYVGEDHSYGYKGIRLWDVETRELKETLKGKMGNIYSVAFSPDGSTLASGEGWADYAIRLWDMVTGEQQLILKGHAGNVKSVAFSPQGNILASGSADNTIRLWDVATGKHIRTFKGHTDDVNSVVFSADGRMLVSGSSDGTILLWDMSSSGDTNNWAK